MKVMNKLKYLILGTLLAFGFYACDDEESTEPENLFGQGIAEKPVTPGASQQAVNVYDYLKQGYGVRVLSGAMSASSVDIGEAQWVFDKTGTWPALACFDFMNHTRDWDWANTADLVPNAKEWWRNRGLVAMMWHWRDPSQVTDEFYATAQSEGGSYTTFDVSKVTDVNSAEYAAMISDIDAIAVFLKELKEAGVPVLWRPLHEASGGWFWWGAKGAESCKTLWKLMFDRLVNTHQLNNLIWVWTSNGKDADWYPGDEYVDIVGADIYDTSEISFAKYFEQVRTATGGKKMVSLSECGKMPEATAMFTEGHPWLWVMPWNGDYTENENYNGDVAWTTLFKDKRVITRDKMPNLK